MRLLAMSEPGTTIRDIERDIKNDLISFEEERNSLNSNIGRYVARRAEDGTWVGAAWNEMMRGMDDIVKGIAGVGADVIINIEEQDPAKRDARQKAFRKDLNDISAGSFTHLTLPTKKEGESSGGAA